MIVIKTASIKAACLLASTKDIRYYLNGVQILIRDTGKVHVRSSDGHMVFDDLMDEESRDGMLDIIIPIEAATLIGKSKSQFVAITKINETQYECEGRLFKPIDGKFPDCDRVIPERDSQFDDVAGQQYDAMLLATCLKAMRIATGNSKAFFRLQNSPCGLMYRENDTYPRCGIVPLNIKAAFVGN